MDNNKTSRVKQNHAGRPRIAGGSGSPIPFTRVSAMAPFVAFLDSIGTPVERLLEQSGIFPDMLENTESLIPLYSAYRFADTAARREGIEDLGLVVAQQTLAFDLGAYGRSLRQASTVHEYLHIGIMLIDSVTSGQRFRLSTEPSRLRFNQYLPDLVGSGRYQADLYSLAVTISTLRHILGQGWYPEEIGLLAGAETLVHDYTVFGNARIVTGQTHSSFTIPHRLVMQPLPDSLYAETYSSSAPAGNDLSMPTGFRESVTQVVETLFYGGYPDIRKTARAAGMSSRTLQRRLAETGLTYSQIIRDCRERLAANWLAQSDIPVMEIATMLGYSNAANFARAFRQQTGMSPRSFRQSCQRRN